MASYVKIIRNVLRVLLCLFGFFLSWMAVLYKLGKPPTSAAPILGILAVPWLLWSMTAKRTQIENVRKIFSVSLAHAKSICSVLPEPDSILPMTVKLEVFEEKKGSYCIGLVGKTNSGKHVRMTVGQLSAQDLGEKWPPSTIRTASGENRLLEYSKGRVSQSCWKDLVLGAKLEESSAG